MQTFVRRNGARHMTRQAQVLKHLLSGRSLTQGEAIVLGYGTRLAARIRDLRVSGHKIHMTMKTDINGIPYGEYRLLVRPRQIAGLSK